MAQEKNINHAEYLKKVEGLLTTFEAKKNVVGAVYYELGNLDIEEKQYEKAIEFYKKAVVKGYQKFDCYESIACA